MILQIRRTSNPVQDIATKIFENFRRHCEHRQANGLNHSSRGQRPRSSIKTILGPVRANQIMSPSVPYAAIVTYPYPLTSFFRLKSVNHGYRQLFGKEFGPTNHASSKTWNAIPSQSAVWRITFTCYAISRRNCRQRRSLEILKKDSSKFIKTLGVPQFSLARWLRAFQCKPIAFRGGQEIHSRPRRASQKGDVPAGISADSEKIPSAVR